MTATTGNTMIAARLLVAQAVVHLAHEGLLPTQNVARAQELLNLPGKTMQEAQQIRSYQNWKPMTWPKSTLIDATSQTNLPRQSEPKPHGLKKVHNARPKRVGADGVELRCSTCEEWKQEDQFMVLADRPHRRRSQCYDCRKDYQRKRYLSKKMEAQLAEAGIEVRLDDDVVGVHCASCDKPIEIGDRITSMHVHMDCEVAE